MKIFGFEFRKVPAQTQAQKRSYDGARITNATIGWITSSLSSDEAIRTNLPRLRDRSRDLERNNDYAKKFFRMVKTNVIGEKGIRYQARIMDDNGIFDTYANNTIETEWELWSKKGNCDVTGGHSFVDIQNLAVKHLAMDGEVLIRKVKGYKNRHRFALQLLEADHLDVTFNDPNRNIVMGIEMDAWGKRIAYHIFKKHPGVLGATKERERVNADEIIHLFMNDRISSNRGVPWIHTAITRLQMLGGYEEAELIAARIGASKAGFYTQPEGETYQGEKDEQGNPVTTITPGEFEILPQGWDFKTYDPQHPNTSYESFVKMMLKGVSSGLDVSYHSLANDLSDVNYSSMRGGVLDERDNWKTIQGFVIEHLMEPVKSDWLEMTLLSGVINLPYAKFEKFNNGEWQGRGWKWVDPLKDSMAMINDIKNNLTSEQRACAALGLDYEDILKERSEAKRLREAYGIIDPNIALDEIANQIQKEGNQ